MSESKKITRRSFLKMSGLVGGAAAATTIAACAPAAPAPAPAAKPTEAPAVKPTEAPAVKKREWVQTGKGGKRAEINSEEACKMRN